MSSLEPNVWPLSAVINEAGAMTIGGADVRDLAREYGTPLFVIDEMDVKTQAAEFMAAFNSAETPCTVHYASKAFSSADVLRWVTDAGLGVDVATGGELELALAAGVPAANIVLHGNNKSLAELQLAIESGVSVIVIDSFDEIARLDSLTRTLDVEINVMIRLTLGVEAHTHEFIATAHEDQKFGLSVNSGAAQDAANAVIATPYLKLIGFHSHIGSQIFDPAGFEVATIRALGFVAHMRDMHGFVTQELDLGGGMGIAYLPSDDPIAIADMAQALRDIVTSECERLNLTVPHLSVEPGRAIIGRSTITLYEVGTIKPIDLDGGVQRLYVSVDGGMSDNIRTALYDAQYTARVVNRIPYGEPVLARIVGKHCESGDIVVKDLMLPSDVVPGDLIAVAATGAYHRSMASNYNMVARPSVISVNRGVAQTLIRRETTEDLLRLDEGISRRSAR